MNIELSTAERDYLVNMLRDQLGNLKGQVRHSATSTFRDQLKAEEKLVTNLMARLGEPAAASAEN